MKKLYFPLLAFLFLMTQGALAQSFTGIDIYSGTGSSEPIDITSFNGKVYFTAEADTMHGWELWVSDGTQGGTTLVKDIWPGPGSGYPYGFMVVGSQMFFHANDSIDGDELWVTDGTALGTHMVTDILPGPGSSFPSQFTAYNGKVYFSANDSIHGLELWVSDGTSGGTGMVKDITPGPGSGEPQAYATGLGSYYFETFNVINGKMYFEANDSVHGLELWVSDGTTGGTNMVADILPGVAGSNPFFMTQLGSNFIFSAQGDTMNGRELWISDGTQAGTQVLKNIAPGTNSSNGGGVVAEYSGFTVMNGKAYFSATQPSTGYELWVTDGTSAGTQIVKDIWPGPGSSFAGYPYALTAFNGKLYFGAADTTNGFQLWTSDGTAGGTTLVKVITSYTPYEGTYPANFIPYNGQLLFTASTDTTNQYQLFTTDGTAGGTHIIAPAISPNVDPMGTLMFSFETPVLTAANGAIFMNANFNSIGDELWVYGFPVGITPVSGDNTISAYPNPFTSSLTLSGLESSCHYTVQIVDMTGREYYSTVIDHPAQDISIAMPAFATGVYLMHVSGQGSTQTFKLVKN